MIRSDLWATLCGDVGARRKHMNYLREAPLDLMTCGESLKYASEEDRNFLVGILSGAYRWNNQQHGDAEDHGCQFCLALQVDV